MNELLEPPITALFHETKAGKCVFESIARPMTGSESSRQWVMVIRDVTREREIQLRDQQHERLAAVGQLAAGISHDFNNILAVIQLYTEMILGQPHLEARLRERLLTIAQQSRRASDLIQQILDFSRRTVLEQQPMDLLPFLKEQVKLLERTLPENIHIRMDFTPGEYYINADPTRMQQAIMNLALNARDAMPQGGELAFMVEKNLYEQEVRCAGCGHPMQGDWIHIAIADTGAGIPAELMAHIFEPFFTTKAPGQGTGLGLAQVYGIIGTHKGHIDVRSQPGQGATFDIHLPALPARQEQPRDADQILLIRGKGETILLVEDEPAIRQALEEGLVLLNYRVSAFPDGCAALDYMNENPNSIDLVLSDVVMPKMGGVTLLQTLRQKSSRIPVILMTGHPMQEELEKMKDEGLTAWILKPPRLKHLASLIAQALR